MWTYIATPLTNWSKNNTLRMTQEEEMLFKHDLVSSRQPCNYLQRFLQLLSAAL